MPPLKLSRSVSYADAIYSTTAIRRGIANVPPEELVANGIALCENVIEPIIEHFRMRIGWESFYRSPELNKAVGGAKNSQHTKFQAVDLDCDKFGGLENVDLFTWVRGNITFDQLIWEFGTSLHPAWVHISYSLTYNRGQILKIYKEGTKTITELIN